MQTSPKNRSLGNSPETVLETNDQKPTPRREPSDATSIEVKERLKLLYGASSNPTYMVLSKASVMIISMGLFFVMKGTWMRGIGSTDDRTCINDLGLNLFTNWHNELRATRNVALKKVMMIMSSEIIDLIFLSMCVIW
jgi:hypothetical protein